MTSTVDEWLIRQIALWPKDIEDMQGDANWNRGLQQIGHEFVEKSSKIVPSGAPR